MEWTHSISVLSKIRQALICNICQNTLVNPVSYGQCCHLFCSECISTHPGGTCPAKGCPAMAEVRSLRLHKSMDSITKSIAKISNIFGDEVPERMMRHLSVDDEENQPGVQIQLKKSEKSSDHVILTAKPEAKKQVLKESNPKVTGGKKVAVVKTVPVKRKRESMIKKQSVVSVELSGEPQIAANKTKKPEKVKSKEVQKPVMNLDKRNKKGETQLHQETLKGNVENVKKLLREGASPNTVDNAGWSPLHEAVAAGNTELVSLLINHGASPNIQDKSSNLTPLHEAAECGYVDIVRLLVSHGADTKARSSTGKTPYDIAMNDGIRDALVNTVSLMTESEAMDQSVVAEDLMLPSNVVLACPESTDSELKKISQAASSLKITKPQKQFSISTTHCLLRSGKKFNILCCQLTGSLPLQEEWIYQSKELGSLVDTELFIFHHPDITEEARQRSRDCRIRAQPGLFTGIHFYLTGGFDSKGMSKSDLTKLIALSGAKIVNREPNPENLPAFEATVAVHADEESGLDRTSHIILYQEGGKKEPLMKYKMSHVKTLPVAWLLQSIFQHKLLQPELFVP